MTTEVLRHGYSNISCTKDRYAFSGAVMPTDLEVSIQKKDKVLLKRLELFFNSFVREKGKLYLNTKGAFHTFQGKCHFLSGGGAFGNFSSFVNF